MFGAGAEMNVSTATASTCSTTASGTVVEENDEDDPHVSVLLDTALPGDGAIVVLGEERGRLGE